MSPVVLDKLVARAIQSSQPVVALESTVITHGLPHPQNLSLARDMEAAVRAQGATPATIAVLNGKIRVGLSDAELEALARDGGMKISRRDFAAAISKNLSGGTTVAGTMFAAHQAGIKVFATGGIGGVHREPRYDVSADLQALADTPLIVVCAGAKAILNLPATLEYLETMSVPVIGFQTGEFPAFYSRQSGLEVSVRLDSVEEVAAFARAHLNPQNRSSMLVVNPIPETDDIPRAELEPIIEKASEEARGRGVHGPALTPFLLQRVNELTEGRSLRANLSLLLNNAQLAGQIARAITVRAHMRSF